MPAVDRAQHTVLENREKQPGASSQVRFRLLAVPFFLSGVAALIYQVCWQRLLFVAFGVDIESITIIVSTFMLGLGIGALVGGRLADRFPDRIVAMFSAIELGIGLFGLASPQVIETVGALTVRQSLPVIALANFMALLVPTLLMGATLPMLVAFLVRAAGSVGVSIGGLYFVNTMGAATGALAIGFVLLHYIELNTAIHAAAAINFLVSASVPLLFRHRS
jgi:predicted membrane-bound spermidine synthase